LRAPDQIAVKLRGPDIPAGRAVGVEDRPRVGPLDHVPPTLPYAFHGAIALDRLVSGVIELKTLSGVASPTGFETLCTVERERFVPAA